MNPHLFHPINEMSVENSSRILNYINKKQNGLASTIQSLGTLTKDPNNPNKFAQGAIDCLQGQNDKLHRLSGKLQSYISNKNYQQNHPILSTVKKGIGSFKRMVGLGEFTMPTYLNLANHIMDKSHDASVKSNDYKAALKKTLAQHYNNKAMRLFSVANNIENHIVSNGHIFNK